MRGLSINLKCPPGICQEEPRKAMRTRAARTASLRTKYLKKGFQNAKNQFVQTSEVCHVCDHYAALLAIALCMNCLDSTRTKGQNRQDASTNIIGVNKSREDEAHGTCSMHGRDSHIA
jgi:hypothetical protein